MDLNSARIFVNVVNKGSFSSAAKSMQIPIATVSRRVAELESKLGVVLLERSTRKLRLTNAGAVLYEFSARGVEEMDAGLLALLEQENNLKGRLRISLPPTFEPMWEILNEFQQIYSNIEVDLFVSERKLDFIADGVDIALRVGDVNSQSVVARRLVTYRHKLVATPTFLDKEKIKIPSDVLRFKCAAWCQKDQEILWRLGENKIKVSPYFRANDYLHMRYLTLNHQCITELPPFFCDQQIENGELIEVLPKFPMPMQDVNLVYPSRKSVSRITRVFIDFCRDHFESVSI